MAPRWVQVVKADPGGYVHWSDDALAAAWFARAVELTSAPVQAQLEAAGAAAQAAGTRDAMQALAYGYQAADVRPTADPAYRATIARRFGRLSQSLENAQAARLGPATCFGGPWMGPQWPESWHTAGATLTELARLWKLLGHPDFGNPNDYPRAVVRIYLDELANPTTLCALDRLEGVGPCDFKPGFPKPVGCAQYHEYTVTGEGCDPYSWWTFAWNDGQGGAAPFFLPPLEWSFAFVRELARACAARSTRELIEQARAFAAVENLATLARARTLPGGEALAGADQLLAFAQAAIVASRTKANADRAQAAAIVGSVFAGAGAIAAPIVPPIGTLVGAALAAAGGLAALFIRLLPPARLLNAEALDDLGRQFPVFEVTEISGKAGSSAADQPTQNIPDPPGYVPAPVQAPGTLSKTACPDPPAGMTQAEATGWRGQLPACPFPASYQYGAGMFEPGGSLYRAPAGTAPAAASSGPSTGLLIAGGAAALVALLGIGYVATR